MVKYSFKDDYSEGCHPRILEILAETNMSQQESYGDDEYCEQAQALIKLRLGNDKVNIHFVSGGTQANLIVISALLRPHESVITAETGHIHVHEAGSIEAVGHKINAVQTSDGKLKPKDIQQVLAEHNIIPHMVKPKMVYISNSTEIGTIYNRQELKDLYKFCSANNLYLFCDGARLGSALTSSVNDLQLADLSLFTDIFYIGGTKNGALIAEAIVINNDKLKPDFAYHMKQRGAMLAKSRLIGIQFLALFKDDLYFELAAHANQMARQIASVIEHNGFSFITQPTTNQIFPILPNTLVEKLLKKYSFHIWQQIDDEYTAIRLVCSWATPQNVVDEFIADINF